MPQLSTGAGVGHVAEAWHWLFDVTTVMPVGRFGIVGTSSSVTVTVKLAFVALPESSVAV